MILISYLNPPQIYKRNQRVISICTFKINTKEKTTRTATYAPLVPINVHVERVRFA